MIDQSIDHCAKADELRQKREEIISGESMVRGKFGEDDIQFARADLPRLDRLIAYHESKCAEQSGKPRIRRRAITAGFKR